MLESAREGSVIRRELFQEAMGAMNRLGEELMDVDACLVAEGLRLVAERHDLEATAALAHRRRDLDDEEAKASLAASREARSQAFEEAREADRRREATEEQS